MESNHTASRNQRGPRGGLVQYSHCSSRTVRKARWLFRVVALLSAGFFGHLRVQERHNASEHCAQSGSAQACMRAFLLCGCALPSCISAAPVHLLRISRMRRAHARVAAGWTLGRRQDRNVVAVNRRGPASTPNTRPPS